jgi:hypothetical protein
MNAGTSKETTRPVLVKSILAPLTARPVVIHAGFDGTAQTTLQHDCLSRHPQVLCLAKPRSEEFSIELRRPEISFNAARVRRLMDELTAGDNEAKAWVLSDDNFSNFPLSMGLNAMRLRSMFPNARIMFTIRNQLSLITSWYAQGANIVRAPEPFLGRHVGFENLLDHEFGNFEESLLHTLEFDKVISVYEDLFGKDNVSVFTFENFITDKAAYHDSICAYLGVDPAPTRDAFAGAHRNARPSGREQSYRAFRNRFLPGVRLRRLIPGGDALQRLFGTYITRGAPAKTEIPAAWRQRLTQMYAAGNNRLAARHGLNLAKQGYPS